MARITRSQSAIQIDKGDLNAISQELFKALDRISSLTKRREIIKPAGDILKDEAQRLAPVGRRVHYRYNTTKLVSSIRAPKGSGVRVATYLPGNLKFSITDIAERRKNIKTYRVIIGPFVRGRRNLLKAGIYGANERTADGYYAQMVFGSARAFRQQVTARALQNKKSAILESISRNLIEFFRKESRENRYVK